MLTACTPKTHVIHGLVEQGSHRIDVLHVGIYGPHRHFHPYSTLVDIGCETTNAIRTPRWVGGSPLEVCDGILLHTTSHYYITLHQAQIGLYCLDYGITIWKWLKIVSNYFESMWHHSILWQWHWLEFIYVKEYARSWNTLNLSSLQLGFPSNFGFCNIWI